MALRKKPYLGKETHMNRNLSVLLLVFCLLFCLLPSAAFAEQDQPDASAAETLSPPEQSVPAASDPEVLTVGSGETAYAYEGMLVYNNGGTVYNSLGTVYNNGGTVYSNDGTVYNNGGIVYANGGTVFNNRGTAYNNHAEVYSFDEAPVHDSHIYGYYELKLADYYEPYVVLSGVTTEPGSEKMIISEDSRFRVSPYPGYLIVSAESDVGLLTRDEEDGSFTLSDVDADTTLTLTIQPEPPAFNNLQSGTYAAGKTVEISGPAGCRIYCSTDGTVPEQSEEYLYSEPFFVDESCIITAVAVAEGLEASAPVRLALAFLNISVPDFPPADAGYSGLPAGNILVANPGFAPAHIDSVGITGPDADAFILSYQGGRTIPAGKTNDSTWTLRPKEGLDAGDYTASVCFALDGGDQFEVPVGFSVLPADSAETGE